MGVQDPRFLLALHVECSIDPCTKLIHHDLLEKEKSVQRKISHGFLSLLHVGHVNVASGLKRRDSGDQAYLN